MQKEDDRRRSRMSRQQVAWWAVTAGSMTVQSAPSCCCIPGQQWLHRSRLCSRARSLHSEWASLHYVLHRVSPGGPCPLLFHNNCPVSGAPLVFAPLHWTPSDDCFWLRVAYVDHHGLVAMQGQGHLYPHMSNWSRQGWWEEGQGGPWHLWGWPMQ